MRRQFIFKSEQLEYELIVRKRRPWWWLLLLLLPLLLLIRFEKTVNVKVISTGPSAYVFGIGVNFSYQRAFMYDRGHFFTNEKVELSSVTDRRGIATFVKLKYSLYSFLVKHFSQAICWSAENCNYSDTIKPIFHNLGYRDTLLLKTSPSFTSLDFYVIDKDDNQPMPGSKVIAISRYNGKSYTDSVTSDVAGRVIFSHLPKCGEVVKIKAAMSGYYPDSIINQPTSELAISKSDKRTLKLAPILKPISFYVQDCESKHPVAGAAVTVNFDFGGLKFHAPAITNVNGIGKGVYSKAHIIAKIHLAATHNYYNTGELAGWHLVRDFINPALYPVEKRTFCLEAKEMKAVLTEVDSVTGRPIAGVKNYVNIVRNGRAQPVATVWSNAAGEVPVSLKTGDRISVCAEHRPDYKDNVTAINNVDAIAIIKGSDKDRTIPLAPVTSAQPPRESCRVFVSGIFISDAPLKKIFSGIYQVDQFSEYVGEGAYPDNAVAFPKAVASSFDGIAIDKGTHVIIFSGKNFTGDTVLNMKGPVIINNERWKNDLRYAFYFREWQTKKFPAALEAVFPPSARVMSKSDMNEWSKGSIKIICDK